MAGTSDGAGPSSAILREPSDVVGQGTVLDHFSESEEVLSLVAGLPQVCEELRSREKSEERFSSILNKYQEQPHLLDPHLELLISRLFLLTTEDNHPIVRQQAFRYMYLVSKVRGSKVMVRWFPHEVSDFEPVLALLQQQDPRDYELWETRYILLLWLSFLLMIPFDLGRMDGGGVAHRTVDRVFEIGKLYVGVSDSCRDQGASLLARLVTRPDVKALKMEEFVGWALDIMSRVDERDISLHVLLSGVLRSLSLLFKHGKREDVVGYAPRVLAALGACSCLMQGNTQLRKQHAKVAYWLGVTFMPPRVAKWRYQRGGRSLEEALLATPTAMPTQSGEGEEEEGYEVPPELEEVLGVLLTALRDRETVVRWTAAKGIGKVTGRLPMELADEVLQSLLEFFTSREDDGAWHGSCLALAELGRRGLLLPQRLSDVVPVVLKALAYDERRGSCSVGSHVRDAACYVCWAFARAYQPEDLGPYVISIASGLLIAMLFDREVNCRRAASAAFQENVGRHGTFPHGIQILTTADYFAVGSINNTYLNISVEIAEFPEYTRPLIDHLCECKLLHWDSAVRELAAKALHNITPLDPLYIKDTILPSLFPLVTTSDLCLRHGALCAVAEVSHALSLLAAKKDVPFGEWIGTETNQALLDVASRLLKGGVFKGAVGEIMRGGVLRFIELMCACQLPVGVAGGGAEVLDTWQAIVDDNLSHTEESIRESAVSAFSGLCASYYSADEATIASTQAKLIPSYTSQLLNHSHFTRMGYSLALGALPMSLLTQQVGVVLHALIESCSDTRPSEAKFAEAKRDAVHSITRICQQLTVPPAEVGVVTGSCDLSTDNVERVFGCYLRCLDDYTMDSRGDIGAVVREAAMAGISALMPALADRGSSLPPELVSSAVSGLVQQSNEKIDRTRALACQALMTLLFHKPLLPHIPFHTELQDLFKEAVTADTNWSVPHSTFPLTVELLAMPPYRYPTLLGMCLSVGGLTESTVRHSSSALLHYMGRMSGNVETLEPLANTLLQILRDYQQDTRVILPLLKTLDLLLSNGVFDVYTNLEKRPFPLSLLELLNKEVKGSRDPFKLLSSINVFCGMLQFAVIKSSVLNRLMLLLCHSFPKVRKSTSEQFYVTLVTFDDLLEPGVSDEVMSVLSDTAWDAPIAEVREKRNTLCKLLQLPIPKLTVKSSANKTPKPRDALASYQDLVDRAGY